MLTQSTTASTKIVPTVSSKAAGPLGATHLPRLWAKLTLACRGLLPEDYDECGDGFDAMTLKAFGLDRDEVINYVRSEHPKYMAFECWVVQKAGGRIDPATIDAHNRSILGYKHSDTTALSMRASCGVTDSSICDAATLNTLDDFDQLHKSVTGQTA